MHIHRATLCTYLSSANLSSDIQTAVHAGLSEHDDIRQAELDAPMISIVKGVTLVLVRLTSLEELAAVSKRRLLDFAHAPESARHWPLGGELRMPLCPDKRGWQPSHPCANDGARIRARE